MPSIVSDVRAIAVAIAVALFVALGLTAAPTPAHADNCQIEQLAGLPALMPEERDPRCVIQKGLGCQNLQDQGGCVIGIATNLIGLPDRAQCVRDYHPLLNAGACRDLIFGQR